MNDPKKLNRLIELLFASKARTLTPEIQAIWVELLAPADPERVEIAIYKYIFSADDFPTIGKLFEIISPNKNYFIDKINENKKLEYQKKIFGNEKGLIT